MISQNKILKFSNKSQRVQDTWLECKIEENLEVQLTVNCRWLERKRKVEREATATEKWERNKEWRGGKVGGQRERKIEGSEERERAYRWSAAKDWQWRHYFSVMGGGDEGTWERERDWFTQFEIFYFRVNYIIGPYLAPIWFLTFCVMSI